LTTAESRRYRFINPLERRIPLTQPTEQTGPVALSEQQADGSGELTTEKFEGAQRPALPNPSGISAKSDAREEMENQLLTAAASLFHRKGFVAATTRELAKSLGLQRASLYHYLESKQDLLYVLCVRGMNSISQEVAEAIETAPPDERLHSAIRAHIEATLRDQDMHAVMLSEFRHLDPERRDEVSRLHHSYHQQIRTLLREEQEAGRLRQDIDTKYLALMLSNLLNWTINWYQPSGPLQPSDLADLLFNLFVDGARSAPAD
jgi:TetR/AcrR family transcriptional regulator, cholesterol catabolism regulator